jgi:hypothetical protein
MGDRPKFSSHQTAMESFTPDESLKYSALKFECAVLRAEQGAIACGVEIMRLQVVQQETRLALVRHRQAQNQLAQAVHKAATPTS